MEIDINKMVDRMNNCHSFICRLHNMAPTAEFFIEEDIQKQPIQYLISKDDALKLFMVFFEFINPNNLISYCYDKLFEYENNNYACAYRAENGKTPMVMANSKNDLRIKIWGKVEPLESRDSVIRIEDLMHNMY